MSCGHDWTPEWKDTPRDKGSRTVVIAKCKNCGKTRRTVITHWPLFEEYVNHTYRD